MSRPRRGEGKGRGGGTAAPDLDALRARVAETLRASDERRAARTRRSVLPGEANGEAGEELAGEELAGEAASAHGPPAELWWLDEGVGCPRPVVGGIVARTRRGPIGASWWSRRFLESLEAVLVGGRMERGRSYARSGQVVELHVDPGVVTAVVQGSREDPYAVHLRMPVVPSGDWDRIVAALAARAGYAARMLAGELPHEVEEVFEAQGASLLPAPHARLVTECTCPDWDNPCTHVAAVCYLLAEELDRDPFSLLAWRGRVRDDVLGALRELRREAAGAAPEADGPGTDGPAGAADAGPTVPAPGEAAGHGIADSTARRSGDGAAPAAGGPFADEGAAGGAADLARRFWEAGPELAQVRVRPEPALVPAALLRLAPRGTISVRGRDLADLLEPDYRELTASAAARARR